MSLAKQSASVFLTKIGQIIIALLLSILVTRAIGPQNRGVLELLSTLPVVFVSLGHLGIGNANLYFIGKGLYSRKKVVENSLSSCLMLSAIMVAILYACYHIFYDSIFKGVDTGYLIITALLIPLTLFQRYLYYIMLGENRIYLQNKLQILTTLLNVVILPVFIFVPLLLIVGFLWKYYRNRARIVNGIEDRESVYLLEGIAVGVLGHCVSILTIDSQMDIFMPIQLVCGGILLRSVLQELAQPQTVTVLKVQEGVA